MTINSKIHQIRKSKNISQAELAYETGYTIDDIIEIEKDGTIINAYTLLQILTALNITIDEFKNWS